MKWVEKGPCTSNRSSAVWDLKLSKCALQRLLPWEGPARCLFAKPLGLLRCGRFHRQNSLIRPPSPRVPDHLAGIVGNGVQRLERRQAYDMADIDDVLRAPGQGNGAIERDYERYWHPRRSRQMQLKSVPSQTALYTKSPKSCCAIIR